MVDCRKVAFMVSVLAVSGMLSAATYEFNDALSSSDTYLDWTSLSSYKGNPASLPGSGDVVEIPAGMTAKVTAGSESWGIVNGVSKIVPKDGAVLEVNVPDGSTAVLEVPVTEYGLSDAKNTGILRKTGGGALELASRGNITGGNYDYYLDVNVGAGHLYFCKGGETASESFMFRNISVEEDATLHICPTGYTKCDNLDGEGFVTLDNTTEQRIYISGKDYSSYGGWMTGPIRIEIEAGRHDITCPTNTINFIRPCGTGICGFTRFGENNSVPSSLGTGNFNMSADAGLIYLGSEPETTEKTLWLTSKMIFDAGAYGGLTLAGKLDTQGGDSRLRTFTISGSNVNPCVISGTFPGKVGQTNVFYLIKKGTGTWRMAHNAARGSLGVIDVEEGVLQFDSIAPKGEACSLGYATNLFEKCEHVLYNQGVPVSYAMVLGGNGTEGTLEYTGTTPEGTAMPGNATRPVAVRSKGRFKVSDVRFELSDVYALGSGEATLTLDGPGEAGYGSLAHNLSDGKKGGNLSVVKEGEGTWQLTGANTFTGSAVSRGGTLLINNNPQYRWYRFVVTENAYSCSRYDTTYSTGSATSSKEEKGQVQISHIAFYDKDGNNLVKNFKQKDPITQFAFVGGDARVMEPGEVAIGQTGTITRFTDPSQKLENLFNTSGYAASGRIIGSDGGIKQDDPSTWLPIVVRLPDDAPAVVRVDFQCGRNREGPGSYNGRNMTAFRLDASVDGINWDEGIAGNPKIDVPENYPKWDSDGSNDSCTSIRKDKGTLVPENGSNEVASPDSYAFTSVGAANGAVLKVLGDPIEVSGLVVDASASAGTISNFKFAESGTVDVRNAEFVDGEPLELPGDYSHLEGVENLAKWGLALDGEYVASKVLGVKNGKLTVFKRGLRVIIR